MASADQISYRNLGRRSSRRPLRKAKSTTQASGAQRSVCASGGEGRVRIDAGTIKKGNSPPQLPRQRLAKRKARKEPLVKCRVLPDDLRVRHGAHGPEDSARPRPCSRRGRRVWGQDSLEPHPVVERALAPGSHNDWRFFFRRLHRHFLFAACKKTTPAGVCRRQPPLCGGS